MRVQIHLRAEKLTNLARGKYLGRRSSPYCTIVSKSTENTNIILGRTEVIHANTSPHFTKSIIIEYDEEVAWTHLKITIRDCRALRSIIGRGGQRRIKSCREDGEEEQQRVARKPFFGLGGINNNTDDHNDDSNYCSDNDPIMGEVDVEVGELLKSDNGKEQTFELSTGGTLFVFITESVQGTDRGVLDCQIRGLDVKNIESGLLGLGAVDPYFVISKKENDTKKGTTCYYDVYRSEHIHDIINPFWKPFRIDLERLCNNDVHKQLKITVWDQQDRGEDRWLGEKDTTVAEMMRCVAKRGNADRESALRVEARSEKGDKIDLRALLVILKADVISANRKMKMANEDSVVICSGRFDTVGVMIENDESSR